MQQTDVLDLIRELRELLTHDALDVAQVVAWVGAVTADPGVPMPIELAPRSPLLSAASLGRYPSTGLPYLLTLEPRADLRPRLGALRAAFGPCHAAPTGRGMPFEYVFAPAGAGGAWTVTLVASVARDDNGGDGLVSSIALGRDPAAPAAGGAGGGTP
jgi:hypothetical protein